MQPDPQTPDPQPSGLQPKDKIDQWIIDHVPGRSFVDIGGIGVGAINERTSIAFKAGASRCTMADIRPKSFWEWDTFHKICDENGVSGVVEIDNVDIRRRETLAPIGRCDVVHSTGILYHVQSPAEALWNLRSITGEYLITNTVCFPGRVTNEFGTVELPDAGILFGAALTDRDRRVLNKYYTDKFGWGVDKMSPKPIDREADHPWIQEDELTSWPYWYFYTEHAFKALLEVCRLEVLDQWWYADHALQVLCRPVD